MKIFLSIFSVVSSFTCFSQNTLIEQIGDDTGFCSNSMYLYSDSTFYLNRGCEGLSYLTMGSFQYKGDSLIVFPLDSNEISLLSNINYHFDNSGFMSVWCKTSDDSTYSLLGKYTSIEKAREWKNNSRKFGDLDQTQYVTTNSENGYSRINENDSIAFCLYDLNGLIGREYFILEPGINKITMDISLPSIITYLLSFNNLGYADMDEGTLELGERTIYVVKN